MLPTQSTDKVLTLSVFKNGLHTPHDALCKVLLVRFHFKTAFYNETPELSLRFIKTILTLEPKMHGT